MRVCVCPRVLYVRMCLLLYQINHACNSLYVQCLYGVYTVYTERFVVVQCILVISTHTMSPLTVEMLKSIFLFLRRQRTGNKRPPTVTNNKF